MSQVNNKKTHKSQSTPEIMYLKSHDLYFEDDCVRVSNSDIVVIEYEDGDPDGDPLEFKYTNKILALDYDHTLVRPNNGRTFQKDIDDYEFMFDNIEDKLLKYEKDGYCIVVFTNQTKSWKLDQIDSVFYDDLNVFYKIYSGITKKYKKPNKYMFDLFISNDGKGFPDGSKKLEIDYENSIYVGDALGRKNDWSDCALLFAKNCGLKYMSPEMFFTGKEKDIKMPVQINNIPFRTPEPGQLTGANNRTDLIIMVGYPASGKTTYANYFKDVIIDGKEKYMVLHGDILKTESKIKKGIKEALHAGKSIVIDATNPSAKKRNTFIEYAYKIKSDIFLKIIHIPDNIDICMERNIKREVVVPRIAFYMYRKNFEPPTLMELEFEINGLPVCLSGNVYEI